MKVYKLPFLGFVEKLLQSLCYVERILILALEICLVDN